MSSVNKEWIDGVKTLTGHRHPSQDLADSGIFANFRCRLPVTDDPKLVFANLRELGRIELSDKDPLWDMQLPLKVSWTIKKSIYEVVLFRIAQSISANKVSIADVRKEFKAERQREAERQKELDGMQKDFKRREDELLEKARSAEERYAKACTEHLQSVQKAKADDEKKKQAQDKKSESEVERLTKELEQAHECLNAQERHLSRIGELAEALSELHSEERTDVIDVDGGAYGANGSKGQKAEMRGVKQGKITQDLILEILKGYRSIHKFEDLSTSSSPHKRRRE